MINSKNGKQQKWHTAKMNLGKNFSRKTLAKINLTKMSKQ